jgi:hypothetical protein
MTTRSLYVVHLFSFTTGAYSLNLQFILNSRALMQAAAITYIVTQWQACAVIGLWARGIYYTLHTASHSFPPPSHVLRARYPFHILYIAHASHSFPPPSHVPRTHYPFPSLFRIPYLQLLAMPPSILSCYFSSHRCCSIK